MKRFWMIYMIVLMSSVTMAQAGMDWDGTKDGRGKEKREMMMMFRLTEELNLTSEQGEKFFPRFREHRKAMDKIRVEMKSSGESIKIKLEKNETLDKGDIKKAVNQIRNSKKAQADLEAEFVLDMGKVLSPEQQAKLAMFKHKMVKDIRKQMKGRHDRDGKKQNRNKRNRW